MLRESHWSTAAPKDKQVVVHPREGTRMSHETEQSADTSPHGEPCKHDAQWESQTRSLHALEPIHRKRPEGAAPWRQQADRGLTGGDEGRGSSAHGGGSPSGDDVSE